MNFNNEIKNLLSLMVLSEKKNKVKIKYKFKKQLIPLLLNLKREGYIYKFTIDSDKLYFTIFLKIIKNRASQKGVYGQKNNSNYFLNSILYKNPSSSIFINTTSGIEVKGKKNKSGQVLFIRF